MNIVMHILYGMAALANTKKKALKTKLDLEAPYKAAPNYGG